MFPIINAILAYFFEFTKNEIYDLHGKKYDSCIATKKNEVKAVS